MRHFLAALSSGTYSAVSRSRLSLKGGVHRFTPIGNQSSADTGVGKNSRKITSNPAGLSLHDNFLSSHVLCIFILCSREKSNARILTKYSEWLNTSAGSRQQPVFRRPVGSRTRLSDQFRGSLERAPGRQHRACFPRLLVFAGILSKFNHLPLTPVETAPSAMAHRARFITHCAAGSAHQSNRPRPMLPPCQLIYSLSLYRRHSHEY